MTDFALTQVEPRAYLYVEGRTFMNPAAIAETLGEAFGTVMDFMDAHGIEGDATPIVLYYNYGDGGITFHAGALVAEDDLRAAVGDVKAGRTPAGLVLHFTHVGPYTTLSESYAAMTRHCTANGLTPAVPTWEIYTDDPDTTPADRLRTEVYVALA
jgi:effector-binding domain-containing protein